MTVSGQVINPYLILKTEIQINIANQNKMFDMIRNFL